MRSKILLCLIALATAVYTSGCRPNCVCDCATVDSAGHYTSMQHFDYGHTSYSKSTDKCNAQQRYFDTCSLSVNK